MTTAMIEPFGTLLKGMGVVTAHIPGANRILANAVEDILKNQMGIEADISLGFLGTGLGSDLNTYKEISTGNTLTHQQVLDRIAKMPKKL